MKGLRLKVSMAAQPEVASLECCLVSAVLLPNNFSLKIWGKVTLNPRWDFNPVPALCTTGLVGWEASHRVYFECT